MKQIKDHFCQISDQMTIVMGNLGMIFNQSCESCKSNEHFNKCNKALLNVRFYLDNLYDDVAVLIDKEENKNV